ncbi:hypothetical protein [Acetobacter senegalensis]|uniref:hypothetical protein n=1 Tax=Acetobacter senegalensis TaxID=446692 RepID=UPI001EDABF96|nr:hypothetical protein [Acetobacter senegalensis]
MMHRPPIGFLAVLSFGLLLMLPSCETASQQIEGKEDHLAAAGFFQKLADTPERQAMLNRLPAHHFVRRVKNDHVFYVYSDPLVCDCLYVGDEAAYSRYQQYVQAQALADEQEMTAQMYDDAQWNWGAWGAWNPAWGNWDPGMGPIGW